MRRVRMILHFGILLGFFIPNAYAAGDPGVGEERARELCTPCHNVEPNGPFKQHPPSFAAIAVYRSEDQILGRIIFPTLHSSMPRLGYMLTPRNIEHLVAYIKSLEKLPE